MEHRAQTNTTPIPLSLRLPAHPDGIPGSSTRSEVQDFLSSLLLSFWVDVPH